MKRTKPMLWAAALSCLAALALFSCSNGLLKDPRLYNAKKDAGGDSAITVAPEPELQLTGGVDAFDLLDEWYNKSDAGDFPHTEFDSMSLVGTYFNNENVPVYFMESGNVWASKDATKAEYVHAKAPNTEGQGYEISNVYWYQYRGKNPLYAMDGPYNTQLQVTAEGNPKLSRFYFYRFTGDTLSPSLDNFLFAVDTYSKFMFAFAYPTKLESVFGNNVPKAWGPTDGSAFLGTTYQFYMYDPVGYVEKVDGKYNVVMYDWFKNNLSKGIYQPTLGGLNDKSQGTALTKVASKDEGSAGAGTSPFNNHKVDFFEENMKLLAKKTFMYREKTADGGNGLKKYIFTISDDGKTLTKSTEVWNGLEDRPADVIYTIETGESATEGVVSGGNNDVSWLKVEDEGQTLVLSNGEKATITFQDYGPQFLERIKKDPSYQRGDDSYKFQVGSPNTLVMNGETYTYAGSSSDNSRTIYKKAIWGVDWFYGVELSASDYTVKMTRASSYNDILWGTLGWQADLQNEKKASFSANVLNSSFHFRPKDDTGDGLYKYTWEFSDQGKKVSLKRTPWNKATETTTIANIAVTDTGSDGLSATAGGTSFTLSADMTNITVSGCSDTSGNGTFSRSFTDPGPSFLNRVKGATYRRGNISYEFSPDGKTLTYSIELSFWDGLNPWGPDASGTLKYDEGSDKNNVIATYGGGYRVHLTENDTIIKLASVPNADDSSDMRWPADRVN